MTSGARAATASATRRPSCSRCRARQRQYRSDAGRGVEGSDTVSTGCPRARKPWAHSSAVRSATPTAGSNASEANITFIVLAAPGAGSGPLSVQTTGRSVEHVSDHGVAVVVRVDVQTHGRRRAGPCPSTDVVNVYRDHLALVGDGGRLVVALERARHIGGLEAGLLVGRLDVSVDSFE